ncbi:MAG: hypothetical protein IJW36_00255 [Clostridia bacterium]|nr:hypothetical protein [Clostridia bacterium]
MLLEELNKKFLKSIDKILYKYNRDVIESVLCDVLSILYFQDYNRAMNYDKMTGKQVVEEQHKVLREIENRYNYHLSEDIL